MAGVVDTIGADIKAAMLAGEKETAEALKMLKSALLYKEVELGVRDSGLNDEQAIEVLNKEAKKRKEAVEMYKSGGRDEQAEKEQFELSLLEKYLPAQMSDEELEAKITEVISGLGDVSIKDMGRVIGAVKAQVGSSADGARVAVLVKEKLS